MVRTALIVLLIAYLPGALIFRLPLAERSRRAALSAEERVFWAVAISLALSSIVAFALAATGRFQLERLILVNGGISLTIGLLWRLKLRFGGEAPQPTRTVGAPLVLAAAGRRDRSSWSRPRSTLTAAEIQRCTSTRGSRSPSADRSSSTTRSSDPFRRSTASCFFRQEPSDASFDTSRFTGFYVLDQEAGTVVGQFPHLYPVWIAIAYETYGLTGARYVHGLWGVLGVLAVYLTGAALFGRRAAFAGAALLAVNVAQVWFARYFCVEMIFQALVFAGVLAYIRAHVDGDRFFAPIAGILIGLTPFLQHHRRRSHRRPRPRRSPGPLRGSALPGVVCAATCGGDGSRGGVLPDGAGNVHAILVLRQAPAGTCRRDRRRARGSRAGVRSRPSSVRGAGQAVAAAGGHGGALDPGRLRPLHPGEGRAPGDA